MPDGPPSGWRANIAPLLRYASVMGIKAGNIATGLIVTLLLARAGGPEVLGSYAMAIQTAQLVSILAVVGCDQLALREVAAHLRLGDKAASASHMRHYLRFVAPLAALVTGLYAGGVWLLLNAGFADVIIRDPLDWKALGIGQEGIIQVVSAIPLSYPGHSLLTEDRGVLTGEDDCPCGRMGRTFRVLGRIPAAEMRGCSDTHTAQAA